MVKAERAKASLSRSRSKSRSRSRSTLNRLDSKMQTKAEGVAEVGSKERRKNRNCHQLDPIALPRVESAVLFPAPTTTSQRTMQHHPRPCMRSLSPPSSFSNPHLSLNPHLLLVSLSRLTATQTLSTTQASLPIPSRMQNVDHQIKSRVSRLCRDLPAPSPPSNLHHYDHHSDDFSEK